MKHPVSWGVFALAACGAVVFITNTGATLPAIVASHFDAAGNPTAYMLRTSYSHFMLLLGIGVPVALVALLTWLYSRATDMKLPNRDYWLAPERIGRTRDILVAHVIWFGSLLISMVCYVHWLELAAHRQQPAHLPNELVYAGLLIFFLITAGWMLAMLQAFRRPRGA
jgi:uncharacterized membrane protein